MMNPQKISSQLQSSEVQTISMDELTKLGVTLDNQLTLLTIRNDGSRVYSVMDIDKPNMICLLTLHSDGIIDITTKDGRDFRLLHSCAAIKIQHQFISINGPQCQHLMSMPHDNASGAIISVITTRNVKNFMKQFVVVTYISTSTIALLTHDRASNYHWQ